MPPEVPSSLLEAIQALVNAGSPSRSRRVIEAYSDDLLPDAADAVLLAELNVRMNEGAERAVCVFEQWRALLAQCRLEGIDRVFERAEQIRAVETALAVLGLSSGPSIAILGEADPFRLSPADMASRSSFLAGMIRPALPLLDANTQPISRAILQAELAYLSCRIPEEAGATHLDEAIAHALAAIPVLQGARLLDRVARAQFGLGISSLGRYSRSKATDDLTKGIEACHTAGWMLILRYDEVRDEKNLNLALDVFQHALQAAPRDTHNWPQRRYDVGIAHHFRYKAERYGATPLSPSRAAIVQAEADDLDRAIDAWRDALDASPADSPDRPTYQSDLALALWERFEKSGAEDDLDAAIKAQRAVIALSAPGDPKRGDSQGKLGMGLHSRFLRTWDAADLDECLEAIRAALAAATPGGAEWADWQSNLGTALRTRFEAMGELTDLDAAVEAHGKSLGVTAAKSAEWVHRQHGLAVALLSRFDLTQVPADLDGAITALESGIALISRRSNNWARYKADLGVARRKRFEKTGAEADIDASVKHLEDALERLPEGSLAWARCKGTYGVSLLGSFQVSRKASALDAAIGAMRDALSVIPKRSWDWGPLQMDLGTALGVRYALLGSDADLQAAVAVYQEALAAYEPEERPDHLHAAATALGDLHFRTGSWAAASDAFAKAAHAFELLYRRQLLVAGRENWLAQRGHFYQRFAYAQARAGDRRGAAVTLERGRARGLSEALDRDGADLRRVRGVDAEAYELYRQAAARLRQLAAVERNGSASAPDDSPIDATAVREAAQQAYADLGTATTRIRRIPGYEDFLAQPDFDDIVGALQPSLPLVYLCTTERGSLTLIIRYSNGTTEVSIEPIWADGFSKDDLNGLLVKSDGGTVVGGYLPGQLGHKPWLEASLAEALPLLGDRILGPLAECLRGCGATGLILIPCDRFGLLPLHAARYRFDERELCLLEEFDVTYIPSTKVLAATRAALSAQGDRPNALVGVGNPTNPRPLRYARAELEEIAALFPEGGRHVLYEEHATKDRLFQNLSFATHVHLACHGQFEADDPLSSHLQLAGGDQLTLRELLDGKRLGTARLVVLSACQTAINDFLRLPDEAVGLPTGCLQAGASGVVSTLWSVDDMSTALLMFKFYEYHLRGDSSAGEGPMLPAQALRRAQLWLRKTTNEELSNLFKEHKRMAPDAPGRLRMSYALAQEKFREFTLREPEERPFADQTYHWAPFIFIGS